MDNDVVEVLRRILQEKGTNYIDDAERIKGLLLDYLPKQRREVNLIIAALREGLVIELRRLGSGKVDSLLLDTLARRLHEAGGYDQHLARWALDTWALSLGLKEEPSSFIENNYQKNSAQLSLSTTCPSQDQVVSKENTITYKPTQNTNLKRRLGKGVVRDFNLTSDSLYLVYSMGLAFYNRKNHQEAFEWFDSCNTCASISSNCELIALGTDKGEINIFNIRQRKLVKTFKIKERVEQVRISSDNKYLISISGNWTISIWDIESGHCRSLGVLFNNLEKICLSYDGKYLGIIRKGYYTNNCFLLDLRSENEIKIAQIENKRVESLAFCQTKPLMSFAINKKIYVLETNRWGEIADFVVDCWNVNYLVFSEDGNYLAGVIDDEIIIVWDLQSGNVVRRIKTEDTKIVKLMFSNDKNSLLILKKNGDVYLRHLLNGRKIWSLEEKENQIVKIAISPKGNYLASVNRSGSVKVWDIRNWRVLKTHSPFFDIGIDIEFMPDERFLALSSYGSVFIFDLFSSDSSYYELRGHRTFVNGLTVSSDGRWIATSAGKRIRVWDAITKRETLNLLGHKKNIIKIYFSHDTQYLASAGEDNNLFIWKTSNWREEGNISFQHWLIDFCFFYDSEHIATLCQNGIVQIWEIKTKKMRYQISQEGLKCISVSPNSKFLAAGDVNGNIYIFDIHNKHLVKTIDAHLDSINSIEFCALGSMLVSGSDDGTVSIWEL